MELFFSCLYANIQFIGRGRNGARPLVIIGAIGIVGKIEIQFQQSLPQIFRFQVSPSAVSFRWRGGIKEWYKIISAVYRNIYLQYFQFFSWCFLYYTDRDSLRIRL